MDGNAGPKQGRSRKNSEHTIRPPPAVPVFKESMKESKYLEFLLREKYNLYEDQERLTERKNAIKFLEEIAREWAITISKKKGLTESDE